MRTLTLSDENLPRGGGDARVVAGLAQARAQPGKGVDTDTMGFPSLPPVGQMTGVSIYRPPSTGRRADICHTREMLPCLLPALPCVIAIHGFDVPGYNTDRFKMQQRQRFETLFSCPRIAGRYQDLSRKLAGS
jgi:hypothetical protein